MKKSFIRRIVSVLIALCMLVLPFAASMSASADSEPECPSIYIPGFMGNSVYLNPGTDEQQLLFPPTTQAIMSTLSSCVTPLTKFVFDRDWDALGKTLSPIVYELLSPVFNSPAGNPQENSGPDWTYPQADTLTANGSYSFEYDWRLDPVVIAEQLNAFIEYVKQYTGSSKVNIRCHSMGGVVMLSYLSLYGYDDFNAVMYDTTAIYGETFNGELFTNQIELSDISIKSYMKYAFFGTSGEVFFNNLIEALYNLGIINGVCDLGNMLLENTYVDVAKVIVPMFAYYPGIWAMIPDEYISTAREYVFEELLVNEGNDYSELIAKLDYYDANIRANKTEKLLDSADYMRVGVISRYNFSAIPATKTWNVMTDGTVDSKSSSFGATYASYGETLSEEYINSLTTTEYLCIDNMVDASTALFPNNTWFIKDLGHSRRIDTLNELTELFFSSDDFNINSNPDFPQFMIYDSQSNKAYPIDEDDVANDRYTDKASDNSLFSLLRAFMEKLFNLIFNSFSSYC